MVNRGAVIFTVCFLILCIPLVSALGEDKASIKLTFAGNDLKAVIDYQNPGSITTPEPRYEWYTAGGKISEIASDTLPRFYFKKGQTIIFKYRDVNNGIEMMKSVKIPNFPPVLEKIEPITARQGKIINVVPKATDIDKDDLFFTFSTPLDENGRWEDTIKYDPGLYTVKVTVSDGQELISQDVVINLTGEYADSRKSIMDRKEEYESEVGKANSIRLRRETKQFSLSKPDTDLEFKIGSLSIVLSKIMFNVNKELLKYTIEVRSIPLSSRPREYEKAPGQVYQYVQINLMNADNENFENVELQFQISKKWFEENSASAYSVKFYEYFEGWESMGSAKMTDFGDYHVYDVPAGPMEGFFAISIDNTVAVTGAAILDEPQLDFEILNEGDGDFVDANTEAPVKPEMKEDKEEKKGFFGKAIFLLILLVIIAIGYFTFSGKKGPEEVIIGGTEGDRDVFSQEIRESRKEMRQKEREARREGKILLAEEKRKRREEERQAKEEELRLREEDKRRMRDEDNKRAEDARRRQEEERKQARSRVQKQRPEPRRAELEIEEVEPSYDDMDLSEASFIEERRRLARLEDDKREREALRRREDERVKREEERRMSRRAKATTKKKPKKEAKPTEEAKPKKSNVKIISEGDWKERMRKKRKQSEDELTIERMDDDV